MYTARANSTASCEPRSHQARLERRTAKSPTEKDDHDAANGPLRNRAPAAAGARLTGAVRFIRGRGCRAAGLASASWHGCRYRQPADLAHHRDGASVPGPVSYTHL